MSGLMDICKHCGGLIMHDVGPWWHHTERSDAETCRIPTLTGLDTIERATPSLGPVVPTAEELALGGQRS